MPFLTIFSAPKPFTNPHIAAIQRNAIRSWVELGADVEVILLGEEEGLAEAASLLGVRHIAQVGRNASGTPLVSSMFELARQNSSSALLACVNADILLLPDFLESARRVASLAEKFLLVGRRWDLDITQELDFCGDWKESLKAELHITGKLHGFSGSDYFIFPRECFREMPAFAIGRAGWDNWMIYAARKNAWPCVDCTESICIVHQNHDYSHLPGGQAHYRLPESIENLRLAGGRRTIFTLLDTDRRLAGGSLEPARFFLRKLAREIEIFPLIRLGSYPLAQVTYAFLHPVRAYRDIRKWLRSRSGGAG